MQKLKKLQKYQEHIIRYALVFLFVATLFVLKPDHLDILYHNNIANAMSEEKKTIVITELNVPILTYHQVRELKTADSDKAKRFIVTPEKFEIEMKRLYDQGYQSIGLDELLEAFDKNNLPAKPIIITFDDGYKSQYENALPILEKYNMKATFFVYTLALDYLGISMTWDQVKDLDRRGMTIAGHTKTHPRLTLILDSTELYDEIQNSKTIIEGKLGHDIKYFAYPYGMNNERVRNEVEASGYKAAVTVEEGLVQSKNNLFKLKRFNMNTDREMNFIE